MIGDLTEEELKNGGPIKLWVAIPALLILPQSGNLDDFVISAARWSGHRYIYVRNINGFWSKRELNSLKYTPNSWSKNSPRDFGLFRTKDAIKVFAFKQKMLGHNIVYHTVLMED